ncbi:hypothetical protein F5Y15DRAFT_423327 [Xylariaceae sp. FL0016]|nr:hypothetical protein F5Y15DRAFT_423327 [Xylariaceae sp. FL0016]
MSTHEGNHSNDGGAFAAMMDDLGNNRLEELALDDESRRHRQKRPPARTAPVLQLQTPRRDREPRSALGEMYSNAIAAGMFDDATAQEVKDLDSLGNGNLHRINQQSGNSFIRRTMSSMQQGVHGYDPAMPGYTRVNGNSQKIAGHERNHAPESHNMPARSNGPHRPTRLQTDAPRVGALGGVIPPGAETKTWGPKQNRPNGHSKPSDPGKISPMLKSSPGTAKGLYPFNAAQVANYPQVQAGEHHVTHIAASKSLPSASTDADKTIVAHLQTPVYTKTPSQVTARTREITEQRPKELPPHLQALQQPNQGSPTSKEGQTPLCIDRAQTRTPSLPAEQIFYQNRVVVKQQVGVTVVGKPGQVVVYKLRYQEVCLWEQELDGESVTSADIREILPFVNTGSTVFVRRYSDNSGEVPRSSAIRFENLSAANIFKKEVENCRKEFCPSKSPLFKEITKTISTGGGNSIPAANGRTDRVKSSNAVNTTEKPEATKLLSGVVRRGDSADTKTMVSTSRDRWSNQSPTKDSLQNPTAGTLIDLDESDEPDELNLLDFSKQIANSEKLKGINMGPSSANMDAGNGVTEAKRPKCSNDGHGLTAQDSSTFIEPKSPYIQESPISPVGKTQDYGVQQIPPEAVEHQDSLLNMEAVEEALAEGLPENGPQFICHMTNEDYKKLIALNENLIQVFEMTAYGRRSSLVKLAALHTGLLFLCRNEEFQKLTRQDQRRTLAVVYNNVLQGHTRIVRSPQSILDLRTHATECPRELEEDQSNGLIKLGGRIELKASTSKPLNTSVTKLSNTSATERPKYNPKVFTEKADKARWFIYESKAQSQVDGETPKEQQKAQKTSRQIQASCSSESPDQTSFKGVAPICVANGEHHSKQISVEAETSHNPNSGQSTTRGQWSGRPQNGNFDAGHGYKTTASPIDHQVAKSASLVPRSVQGQGVDKKSPQLPLKVSKAKDFRHLIWVGTDEEDVDDESLQLSLGPTQGKELGKLDWIDTNQEAKDKASQPSSLKSRAKSKGLAESKWAVLG